MTDEAALLRRIYAAWNSSADFDAIAKAYYHPDVVWHEDSQLPGASSHRGRDAVLGYMRALVDTVGTFSVEMEDVVSAGDGRWLVMFRLVGEGTLSGIPFEVWSGHLVTFRDGLVAEVRHFLDRDEALAATR